MAARTQLPGMRWQLWLRNEALRSGILTGIYLSCVLVAWLEIANRVPELEAYAASAIWWPVRFWSAYWRFQHSVSATSPQDYSLPD